MKKLIFIDNDNDNSVETSMSYIQQTLKHEANFDRDLLNSIQTVAGFVNLSRDEQANLIFNKDHCILTWSVYTATHMNSQGQFFRFLASSGQYDIKDCTYVDVSGMLGECVSRHLRNKENQLAMLIGLQNNFIVTRNYERSLDILKENGMVRMMPYIPNKLYSDPFQLEKFDLLEHIKN